MVKMNGVHVCKLLTLWWKWMVRMCLIASCFIPTANIFEGCKFRGFPCFPSNEKIISMKMNGQLVMWLNYACNLWILCATKSKFNKLAKFVAQEIFALYGSQYNYTCCSKVPVYTESISDNITLYMKKTV